MSGHRARLPAEALGWSNAQRGARALMPPSHPARLLGGGMAVADTAVIIGASFLTFAVRHGPVSIPPVVSLVTLLTVLLALNMLRFLGCYGRQLARPLATQFGRVVQGWSGAFGVLVVLAFVTHTSDEFSRAWAIGWYLVTLAGLLLVRAAGALHVGRWRRAGRLAHMVAVVDLDGRGRALAGMLRRCGNADIRLIGVFGLPAPGQGRADSEGVSSEGAGSGIGDLVALSRKFRVDEILVSASSDGDGELAQVIARLEAIPANIRLRPNLPAMAAASPDMASLYGQPVLMVSSRPLRDWARIAKRTEDLVLSLVLLAVSAPALALIAVAIKLDSDGVVLFRQNRHGFNNNVISVFKFRTMVERPEEGGVPQARRSDPRVTRVGRLLRRTSLDELPQLLNVIKGEMSLVGPRPHAVAHNEHYAAVIDGYLGRHRVQPGITGWAQVNGLRGETDTLDKMQRRVDHDLFYTRNWSLWLDLKILAMTLLTTAFDRNAY